MGPRSARSDSAVSTDHPLGGLLADVTEGSAVPIAFADITSVVAFGCSLTMRPGAVDMSA